MVQKIKKNETNFMGKDMSRKRVMEEQEQENYCGKIWP